MIFICKIFNLLSLQKQGIIEAIAAAVPSTVNVEKELY